MNKNTPGEYPASGIFTSEDFKSLSRWCVDQAAQCGEGTVANWRSAMLNLCSDALDQASNTRQWSIFKCGVRRSIDPPQDCDWPCCGCDPYADKVIATLIEIGWGPNKPLVIPIAISGQAPLKPGMKK